MQCRIVLTIILNGLHHLLHNDYYKILVSNTDYWVIVEGVSLPGGSTSWCRLLPTSLHHNFLSNDGTTEFLDEIKSKYSNVHVVRSKTGWWPSKDTQVNAGITTLKEFNINEGLLWQVDIDEQWNPSDMESAEKMLKDNGGKTGAFTCKYWASPYHIAKGVWGECPPDLYRRLWIWKGEFFNTHEPPLLQGNNHPILHLPQKFNHYAYYFEKDVKFKNEFYNYPNLLENWNKLKLSNQDHHVSFLLGNTSTWGRSQTTLVYVK